MTPLGIDVSSAWVIVGGYALAMVVFAIWARRDLGLSLIHISEPHET